MVVILKPKTSNEAIKKLTGELESLGVTVNPVTGTEMSILGLVGDTTKIDPSYIEANPNVERVMKVQEPFKKANRLFHPENTVINVNGHTIGGNKIAVKADIIQVGARNMQNFDLLKELGKIDKPILLKRGLSATIEELLMSAEYIMAGGNEKVILCERGIRTFETYTRNTLDLSAVPAIKRLSHLPVVIDPSHSAGKWWMVEPLAKAAVAVGADGLIIEVHNDPQKALCDGQQSIKPDVFAKLMEDLKLIAAAVGREI